MSRLPWFTFLVLVSLNLSSQQTMGEISFESPNQFLSNKESEIVAIVKTSSVRNVFSLDEGITPLLLSECMMEDRIVGDNSWRVGSKQILAQWDACSSPMNPAAPPILEGRRYLVWARMTPTGMTNVSCDWFALPDGCFLIRDHEKGEFVYWEGQCYLVSAIKELLTSNKSIPFDEIEDPDARIEKANAAIDSGRVEDLEAVIRGLLLNVRDPINQAEHSGEYLRVIARDGGEDENYLSYKSHEICFRSLSLLRDLGLIPEYKPSVVESFKPLLKHENPKVRFVTAASLADLGDPSGQEELIQAFENNVGGISTAGGATGPWGSYFPGNFKYDNPKSSIATAAYYLAKIGDLRGLQNEDAKVKKAAQEGAASPKSQPPHLTELVPSLSDADDQNEKTTSPSQDELANIEKQLVSPISEERAQAIVEAGILGIDEFYDQILQTAFEGSEMERLAAISSLGFYDRPLEEEFLRRLIEADGDMMYRLTALELATRTGPSRFIDSAMTIVTKLSDQFDLERNEYGYLTQGEDELLTITRILNRMPRNVIPEPMIEALQHKNPEIRWMMVNGFWMGGYPEAVSFVERLKDDPDPEVNKAVTRALATLGPPGN